MAKKDTKKTIDVPDAPFRPGEEASFESWPWNPGDYAMPDPKTCSPEDTSELAYGLVRVLDDDGGASGEWDPGLSADELRMGLEHMVRLRIFDDRMMKMQRTGLLSFYMRSFGEEAVAIAQTMALEEQDWIFPTYRQPGAQFVRGRSMVSMICHCIGNEEDNIKGRQMPVHYSYREGRFISVSSPVGTQFSQAVGVALASKYKDLDEVTITWIGDGASAEGDYHYALTFASVYNAPVILNVVNNQWAISTHANFASGIANFAARGLPYGLASIRVDGNDCSSDDPSRYRPGDEHTKWPGGDPVSRLKQHLIHIGDWSEERHSELEERIDSEVVEAYKEAVKFGDLANGPYPSADTIFTEVYEEMPWHLKEQHDEVMGD